MRGLMEDKKLFLKKLVSLVLPITFQQFMLAVVSALDAIMLGALSQDSMSAVSLAGQVQFVFNLFLWGITAGTSIFAAQYWGKGDKDTVERLLGIVYRVTVPVSMLFSIFTLAIPSELMSIFTNERTLIDYGAEYLRTVSLSYLLCGLSQIYLCIMKNSGRAFMSSLISSVCVLINILFNALFIFGLIGFPKLGIAGAAIATVIARAAELVWALCDSIKKDRIKMRPKYFIAIDKELRRKFWKYTLPVLGNQFVWGLGFTMGTVIIGRLGPDAIAANSIANIAKNLAVCFCTGVASGGGILVGNELGAGNLERAKIFGNKICKMSVISGIITGLILLALSPLIRMFAKLTPQADEYLKWMFFICAYYLVGKSINGTTIGGIFCAGGDSKFGLICDTVTLWAVVVPLGLIAAFVLKLPVMAVYFVINLDEIIKLPAVFRHYRKYNWLKDLTVRPEYSTLKPAG